MDIKDARVILKKVKSLKNTTNDIRKGLEILEKYHEDHVTCQFEHVRIYAGSEPFEELVQRMSEEDVTRMVELGWFEEKGLWAHF